MCPSVRWSVRWSLRRSVRRSVGHAFFFYRLVVAGSSWNIGRKYNESVQYGISVFKWFLFSLFGRKPASVFSAPDIDGAGQKLFFFVSVFFSERQSQVQGYGLDSNTLLLFILPT